MRSGFCGFAITLAAFAPFAGHAGTVTLPAVEVTLTGWAFGHGNAVDATGYSGYAGAFGGTLSGAGMFDSGSFQTYCIELEEEFSFGRSAMRGYQVEDGASYFQARRGDAAIADRLGRLLTYVADSPTRVDSAAGSTAMQLAVWNIVYDVDFSLAGAGRFSDASVYGAQANALLAGAAGVQASRFDVFALERSGTQDFLLARARDPATADNGVPEPGSLALAVAALAVLCGLSVAGRNRI